ncbi:glutathione S-transferase family protein [Qipengyuania spongiae]|uniref:Glutathione S-transferase family protein n=1 Tax=Qipengyuania spongiae TaxID=2909673 RepID=A0ABY5SW51_9SPHN|nr:glutathione S-transferase family protein [Qipengyuania spongiae]UVI38444.1 glutathione S-transferase family protein [Qipengyuania spongiae]
MADYTFFFNPMSRAQIARWALHEAGADYESVHVPWDDRPRALLDANPMGKLPTIIHHSASGDHVVTEAAAICHYLAEQQAPELLAKASEMADYFRWLFFAAGPVEQAVTAKAMGWQVPEDREAMAGFGSFDRTIDSLDGLLSGRDWVVGGRFTMADVYVGSQVDWGLAFGTMPERESFKAYAERCRAREAYRTAKAIDEKLIGEMQDG